VIHRDIKPSNLMFSSSGLLKILDFGIARLSQTTAPALTTTNAVMGSAPYLSPEQAVGAASDERSDLYSLGCVLTTMMTGQPPFTGEHPMAVLQQHVNNDPPLLRARRPDVSPALEALVAQLLHKRSSGRPASADEVEERLRRLGAGRDEASSGATATVLATVAPKTVVLEPAVTRPYPTPSIPPTIVASHPQGVLADESTRMQPRSWLLIAAALVVGVVLAAAVLTSLLNPTSEGASGPTAPRTPSIPTKSTTPSPSPIATPQVPTAAPTSPLAHVRAVVDAVVADGLMDPRKAEEFGHRLDDLAKKRDEGNKGAGKHADDLSKYLTRLVRSGDLTPEGFRRIDAALAGV
jgi:serine/threonine-protein kinase